jgi:glycosyltransferase involved in cell wall biosynthesis
VRLLILADHWGDLGGGEVVAAQLARGLVQRGGLQVAVLTTDRQRGSVGSWEGGPVYRIRSSYPARLRPCFGLLNPLALGSVGEVLRSFQPDLVHAWNVHQHLSYASLALARARGIPTVLTYQDALPFCYTKYHCYIDRAAPCPPRPRYRARPQTCRSCWRHYWLFPPRNRLTRLLLRRAVSQPVAVSAALAEALVQNGLPRPRVIHNGLPLDDFPPPLAARQVLAQRYDLTDETVVSGGRMGFFKGQLQLLEAFARLAPRRPAARLALAGRRDDWFGRLLERRAAELGLAERLIWTGFLPRPEFLALLTAGALFACLSLYLDPFPTVNLETGAAGRPVLGTCFGGTSEVVLEGQTGRIVNPFRTEEIAAALEALLADPAERTRLGAQAAARIRDRFPLCKMVQSYAELFESLA